ncbi:hypothetical protein EDEG_01151 [Edhazardia aedis USNM 41457]|uniref:Uncharacterized protein n=1 Tax=Edhazardia aedis (strain USNM 41457) TaxID=1003232 RepID=J9DAX5_EDHAE|nr:hypothetical protein EDEG_01151 [Edhazardia aedis USNM 41457]|eukprot:EJW04644.1 hypothetical protein EDEG_01151 [Edhazardia aedis USNM 41457]
MPEIGFYYYPFYLDKPDIGGFFVFYGYAKFWNASLIKFCDIIIDDVMYEVLNYQKTCYFDIEENIKKLNNEENYELTKKFIWILRKGFVRYNILEILSKKPKKDDTDAILNNMKYNADTDKLISKSKYKMQIHVYFPEIQENISPLFFCKKVQIYISLS